MYVQKYKLNLVRDGRVHLDSISVTTPQKAAKVLQEAINDSDREQFWVIMLNTRNKIIGMSMVGMGGIDKCPVDVRGIFKPALLANAVAIIVGHNHISGVLEASPEDIAVTKRIKEAGEYIGIQLLDHMIIDGIGGHLSLKEQGIV